MPLWIRAIKGYALKEYDYIEQKLYWENWYLPPFSIKKDDLILDVGARDGDSMIFYFEHGYRNIRLIEPNLDYVKNLRHNIKILQKKGMKIEVRIKPFGREDLKGVQFAKFDCEGCEYEIDLTQLQIPIVAEIHERKSKDNGIYPYVKAKGYRRYGYL